jgi:hypothetical protein
MTDRHAAKVRSSRAAPMMSWRLATLDLASPLALVVAAEIGKDGVMRDLRESAVKWCGSYEAGTKDLLANTLVSMVDPDGDPWRPGTHGSLGDFMTLEVQSDARAGVLPSSTWPIRRR